MLKAYYITLLSPFCPHNHSNCPKMTNKVQFFKKDSKEIAHGLAAHKA